MADFGELDSSDFAEVSRVGEVGGHQKGDHGLSFLLVEGSTE